MTGTEQAFRNALAEIMRQCSYLPSRGEPRALVEARTAIERIVSPFLREEEP